MKWRVRPGVRVDLVGYNAVDMAGKRTAAQLFPGGARRGDLDGGIRSLVVRAVPHTRVILAASSGEDWTLAAWRCIRVLPGSSVPSRRRNGLPGVRVPNLDTLDPYDAKRTDPQVEMGYPRVESPELGQGWTFGGGGSVAGRVRLIVVEREGAEGRVEHPVERVARAILDRIPAEARGPALDAAVAQLRRELAGDDVEERIRALMARYLD